MPARGNLFLLIFAAVWAEAEERIRPHREAYEAALASAQAGDIAAIDRLPLLATALLQEAGR